MKFPFLNERVRSSPIGDRGRRTPGSGLIAVLRPIVPPHASGLTTPQIGYAKYRNRDS
jgi:hypothetical protein